jgi:hypothetical protein
MKFTTMCLGSNIGKNQNGSFSGLGDWTLFKCFVSEEDGRYGEFYFNLNTKTGEGEIKAKDSNYSKSLISLFKEEMG